MTTHYYYTSVTTFNHPVTNDKRENYFYQYLDTSESVAHQDCKNYMEHTESVPDIFRDLGVDVYIVCMLVSSDSHEPIREVHYAN